jgi:hypothetical protein
LIRAATMKRVLNPLAGLSRRSWIAIALCLAHALLVRAALSASDSPSVHQWAIVPSNTLGRALIVSVKLLALSWLAWLFVLWPLIDAGRKRWVPVVLLAGFACLGWHGLQFEILLLVWVLTTGNLGN